MTHEVLPAKPQRRVRPLAVLVVHSWYTSGPVSGVNRVVEDEIRLLREYGHTVDCLTASPKVNSSRDLVKAGLDSVWSPSGLRRVSDAVAAARYDAVHFHNVFPDFSPAAFRVAAPVYVTLHSYRLTCIAGTLLREGKTCEECLGGSPWPGVRYKCFRGSRGASAAMAASLVVHRRLGTLRRVRRFVTVSEFQRGKHIEAGMAPAQLVVKPNFAWDTAQRSGPGDAFLFAGRVVDTKGIELLVRAWRALPHRLVVAGDGPLLEWARRQAVPNVEFVGRLEPPALREVMRHARAVLVPSRWYEGAPRTVVEAFAAGVPVIASRIGSLPELVEHGTSGLLVGHDDTDGWCDAVRVLASDDQSIALGRGAREAWERAFSPERAIANLEHVYTESE